jgi:hypothetical protein
LVGDYAVTNNIHGILQYAIKNIYKVSNLDSEEQAWDAVVSWLTRLRLLEGVPFNYIVPSEEMLPNESIRFFHMDRNWLDALVDGALSSGILDTRGPFASADEETKMELYDKLINELNDRELIHNPLRASLTMHDKAKFEDSSIFDSITSKATEKIQRGSTTPGVEAQPKMNFALAMNEAITSVSNFKYSIGGQQSGFLIRSSIVRDYPGLEISAYDAPSLIGLQREQAYSEEYRIETLRQVRLSDSIMLVILNGLPSHIRIKEPGEGIRMGVDLPGGASSDDTWRYIIKLKDVNGDLITQSQPNGINTNETKYIRSRAGTGDVSVLRLSDITSASPNGWDSHTSRLLKGGFLATQLMQFPYQQDFQYDSIHQSSVGSGSARVNSNSILVDDDMIVNTGNNPDGTSNG